MGNESELQVITKAKELCEYIMTITQKSPKHFRFTFVTRLQNLSLDIIENLYRANEVLVGGRHGIAHWPERVEFQRRALTDTRLLAYFAELAMRQQCILPKQYERIANLTTDCRYMTAAWINSDKKRFSPQDSDGKPTAAPCVPHRFDARSFTLSWVACARSKGTEFLFDRALRKMNEELVLGSITDAEVKRRIDSYVGHFRHGHTYHLRRKLLQSKE
jgi:hypothetical protein